MSDKEIIDKLIDLTDGTIDHFDREDAMDMLYEVKRLIDKREDSSFYGKLQEDPLMCCPFCGRYARHVNCTCGKDQRWMIACYGCGARVYSDSHLYQCEVARIEAIKKEMEQEVTRNDA